MKITVIRKFSKEQEESLSLARMNASLVGKAVGVPAPFTVSNTIAKEVFELIAIPFDSINIAKKGLLKYGKKYKPSIEFALGEVFFEHGQARMSANDERSFGSAESAIDFPQKPKTIVIHVGICNKKFAIILAHKDYIDKNVIDINAVLPALFFGFETPDNVFPYPVNADWHGLIGSWEHYEAKRQRKQLTEPFLYNEFPCEINIHENEEYVPIAYIHDYGTSRVMNVIASNGNVLETISSSVKIEYNIHDMVVDFLLKCKTSGIIESGYVPQSPNPISFGEVNKVSYQETLSGSSKKTIKGSSKTNNDAEMLKLQNKIDSLELKLKEMTAIAQRGNEEKNIREALIKSTIGEQTEAIARIYLLSDKYGVSVSSAGSGSDLLVAGKHAFDFLMHYIEQLDKPTTAMLKEARPNYINLLFNKGVVSIQIERFDGKMFLICVLEEGKPARYVRMYQLVNLKELKEWVSTALEHVEKKIIFENHESGHHNNNKDYMKMYMRFLEAIFRYENHCMSSAMAVNSVFALEEED